MDYANMKRRYIWTEEKPSNTNVMHNFISSSVEARFTYNTECVIIRSVMGISHENLIILWTIVNNDVMSILSL